MKFGEPFKAKVVAWSQAETQGRLSLFRNGEFLGSQVVKLNAGKNVFSYRQSLEQSGIHVFQAAIDVEGDIIEENNRAVGTVVVRGRPQVLLVEKDRSQAQALTAALRAQHVDVDLVEAERIPKDMQVTQEGEQLLVTRPTDRGEHSALPRGAPKPARGRLSTAGGRRGSAASPPDHRRGARRSSGRSAAPPRPGFRGLPGE